MRYVKLDQKGLTIIELLAAIVLLTIVLSLAFSSYAFGVKSFQRANEQSELQDQVRIVSHVITSKLRYASEVELLSSCPTNLTEGFNYICMNSNKKTIDLHTYDKTTSAHKLQSLNTASSKHPITYDIAFQKTNDHLLSYSLKSMADQQKFDVQSEILLLNLDLNAVSIKITGSTPYQGIAFKENA
ncbi:hypothetical protein BVG16_05775 [Paenibacillus selenitireducens]|uniref:Prepilin-type N-terminal cleavage/methylation domain-containing protein n=1 Tax=Paenibacillus selenitireducens TaxID=1324314 RepID=A0A1T2XKA0_9BACL|nr:type II secretion system protein [Paenibacillus selenitireducens]OPA80248.1 hypothetical protein BVG16_05775 [Paenibacillus selenitireducens]